MADIGIRREFVEATQEIFTELFNNGSELIDGVFYYELDESSTVVNDVYGESKQKVYKEPKLLVCRVSLNPTQGTEDVEAIKNQAEFKTPIKTLQLNNLGVTNEDLAKMRKGMMQYHGVFYTIDNVSPTTYVEDTFLFYKFTCTEELHTTSLMIAKEEDNV